MTERSQYRAHVPVPSPDAVSLDWARMDRDRWRSQAEASKADADRLRLRAMAAEEDAERFRLALVQVCDAQDFEGAYAAAVDALRTPEARGQTP